MSSLIPISTAVTARFTTSSKKVRRDSEYKPNRYRVTFCSQYMLLARGGLNIPELSEVLTVADILHIRMDTMRQSG